MRVPGIFWGPGLVEPGVIRLQGSTLDLLPTFVEWAGGTTPGDRAIDGVDIGEVLRSGEDGVESPPREIMFFYRDEDLFAVRSGRYKAHFRTREGYGQPKVDLHDNPLLFDLDVDPGEQYDVAADHPDRIEAIRELIKGHKDGLAPVENQLIPRIPSSTSK